jgi:sodium pump decarboxylase gamma subunit
MLTEQLGQALTLFGLGMGTVFLLLSILISCVSLLSWLCNSIAVTSSPASSTTGTAISTDQQEELKAVELAIKQHRNALGL